MTSLSLFNHFCPVMSYRRVQQEKESDELLYAVPVIRYGPQSLLNIIKMIFIFILQQIIIKMIKLNIINKNK